MPRLRAVMVVVVGGLLLAGCGRDREAAQAAADAQIGIETSQMFVTIENKAGMPLIDLRVAIVAPGAPRYTRLISRLESSEKRDISLADFVSRDGTTFNLRMVRPRTVEAAGTDLTGKKVEAQVRWQ